MKFTGSVALGLCGLLGLSLVIVELTKAQDQPFAVEARTFADVTGTLAGTWTLKQRTNPDGTPYRSRLEGVTYVSMSSRTGSLIGPHAVATLYAKESGVADTHFFNYPADVAGKPFEMESSSTWMVHSVTSANKSSQVSAKTFTVAKGNLPGYTNGVVYSADVRFNLARLAAVAGAAPVPRMELASLVPGQLVDFAGKRVQSEAMVAACCGMVSLFVTQDTMEINWSNKGKDTWVRSAKTVPAAFR